MTAKDFLPLASVMADSRDQFMSAYMKEAARIEFLQWMSDGGMLVKFATSVQDSKANIREAIDKELSLKSHG
jgi:hypothetical protein